MENVVGVLQTTGLVLGALGFSAAPWVAALLWGRILTRKQHEDRVGDLKEQRDKAEARANVEYTRAETERTRAENANAKLAEVAGAFGSQAIGLLEEIRSGGDGGGR